MGELVRKRLSLATAAGAAVAMLALSGCASDEVSAQSAPRPEAETTTTTEATTTTTAAPTTTAPPTTAAPTTAPPTTAAPAATEPPPLAWSPEGEASPQTVSLDKYEVTAGDVVTASVSGFAPGASLSHGFVGVWPPAGVPDEDHIPTYMPDVAAADASGAATLQIEVPEVCGKGDCFIAVMDGIGYQAHYAARQLTYVG